MKFERCFETHDALLMEGALGERLKREYGCRPDPHVALARHVSDAQGRAALRALWLEYAAIAARYGLPFLATTPTRRANRERVALAGLDGGLIRDNVALLRSVQAECGTEMYVGGMLGCRGDAYTGRGALEREEAHRFHQWQAELFGEAGVDFLYGALLPTLPEAAGLAEAMAATGLPYIVSFTIQADGRLVDGTAIGDAIACLDSTVSKSPLCYMTNCVHPRIVREALSQPCNAHPLVGRRFLGIQANTSPLSYAELDGASDLMSSEPVTFAEEMLALGRSNPGMKIFGGCCGTDGRHMEEIAKRLIGLRGQEENTPRLETERLILRKFTEADTAALLEILRDREVNRFLPWFPLDTLEEARSFLQARFLAFYRLPAAYRYAVCLKGENVPIGYVNLSDSESHDLGYGLRKEFWHRGIMTEACGAVVERLRQAGIPYITATHDVKNPHSGGVMKKLGMTYRYSYEELVQPKGELVTFRMYQLNLAGSPDWNYREYWENASCRFVEQEPEE